MNYPDNTPKWLLGHDINKSEIARNIGISATLMIMKIKHTNNKFTTSQLEALEKERIRLLTMLSKSRQPKKMLSKRKYVPTNAPAWLLDYTFNKAEIGKNVGICGTGINQKIKGYAGNKFTPSQLVALDIERVRLSVLLTTPAWLMDYTFNLSEISRKIRISPWLSRNKVRQPQNNKFTTSQLEALEKERVRLLLLLATSH